MSVYGMPQVFFCICLLCSDLFRFVVDLNVFLYVKSRISVLAWVYFIVTFAKINIKKIR